MKMAPVFDMPNLGSSLDLNSYLYKFMSKRSLITDKDEFIKFYQENQIILDMIEYCEVINVESIKSKVYSVDTASDFFGFLSVSLEDNKFIKGINKLRDIIEASF